MKTVYFLYLLFFVFLMCMGQILFKTALILSQSYNSINISKLFESLLILIKIPYFFLALIVYASATLFLVVHFAKNTIKYCLSIYSFSNGYNSCFKYFSFPRKA